MIRSVHGNGASPPPFADPFQVNSNRIESQAHLFQS